MPASTNETLHFYIFLLLYDRKIIFPRCENILITSWIHYDENKALEARGHKITIKTEENRGNWSICSTSVSVLEQEINFRIKERLYQVELPPDSSRSWRSFNLKPAGKLFLEITSYYVANGPRKILSDTSTKLLEEHLNDFIISLLKSSIYRRTCEIKAEI